MTDRNIIVAFGGISPEHEVSVLSAMQAIAALKDTSYSILPLYVTKSGRWLTGEYLLQLEHFQDLDELESQGTPCMFSHDEIGKPILLETQRKSLFSKPRQHSVYAAIPAFHGSEGENGSFQGVCEMFNIPYAGSGVLASSVGMDKVRAKDLCRAGDIPVVEGISFTESQWQEKQKELTQQAQSLDYPVIVKPVNLGSSIGVHRADNEDELIEAVETAFRYDSRLLVEKAIQPLMEINCSVLGNPDNARSSVCERPLGKAETLSFEDKYQSDGGSNKGMASADRIIPADIPDDLRDRIQSTAVSIFKTFRAGGVARLDFLVNADTHDIYFNEINTIPGSFSFYLWEKSDMPIKALMLELIDIAVKQHREKTGRIRSYETNLLNEKAAKGIKGLKGSKT